jgi:hypothetical protein
MARREPGPLTISRKVSDAWLMLRAQEQVLCARRRETMPTIELHPTLSFEAVTDLEEFLSISIPDEILALFAVGFFELSALTRLDEESMKNGWMGSQRGGKRLLYIGQLPAHDELIAIPRTRLRSDAPRIYVFPESSKLLHESPQGGEVIHALPDWLTHLRERALGELELTEEEHERIDSAPFLGLLTPTLVELPRASASAAKAMQRRVQHTKFGAGLVTQEHADGTLTIAFDEAGEKVLLARFVKDL